MVVGILGYQVVVLVLVDTCLGSAKCQNYCSESKIGSESFELLFTCGPHIRILHLQSIADSRSTDFVGEVRLPSFGF